jgi:biopolymer transport protein ExbB/TolQ
MFGLMGTLIPLGPGLQALAQGDVAALSKSLTIAFDSTICGLACAETGYILAMIRQRWYNQYISQLESIMESLLEKIHPKKAEDRESIEEKGLYEKAKVELKEVRVNA